MTEKALIPITAGQVPAMDEQTRARVAGYLDSSISPNTRRAYAGFVGQFVTWCQRRGYAPLPADPVIIVEYLTGLADQGIKAASINSIRAAIRKAHEVAGYEDPTALPLVRQTLKGIRRQIGTAQAQKAPLLPVDIRALVGAIPAGTVKGKRDRALILLGFFTACRRSEVAALLVSDLSETIEGLSVTIRKSKTDQEGAGMVKAVTRQEDPAFCPVRATQEYLRAAGITSGPLFREIRKGGKVLPTAITGHSIGRLVKLSAGAAGLDPAKYSGHSLRAGLVTSAAKAGASMGEIMAQTGHKSTDTVTRYIRKARLFDDAVTRRIKI